MILGDIQRVKVVIDGLDFRPRLDPESETEKNLLDFALHPGDGMD